MKGKKMYYAISLLDKDFINTNLTDNITIFVANTDLEFKNEVLDFIDDNSLSDDEVLDIVIYKIDTNNKIKVRLSKEVEIISSPTNSGN